MLPKSSLILLFLVFISCENSTSSLQDEEYIVYGVGDDTLTVQNKLRKPIYYFVVDANTATLISWAPLSTEDNKIEARQGTQIPLEEIYGYEQGSRLVFYYWWKEQPEGKEIKHLPIEIE